MADAVNYLRAIYTTKSAFCGIILANKGENHGLFLCRFNHRIRAFELGADQAVGKADGE